MALSKRFKRGLLFFSSAGAIGFFVLVVWHAAVTQKTPENLPVIAAPVDPARVTPEFPSGMQNPNEDLSIYDTFDESDSDIIDGKDSDAGEFSIDENKKRSESIGDMTRVDARENIEILDSVAESKEPTLDLEESSFAAQLGAFGTSGAAEEGWKFRTSKHSSIMAGLKPVITPVDLGEVGILYRLQTELLGSRGQVEEFCQVLRQSGADCLVVRP